MYPHPEKLCCCFSLQHLWAIKSCIQFMQLPNKPALSLLHFVLFHTNSHRIVWIMWRYFQSFILYLNYLYLNIASDLLTRTKLGLSVSVRLSAHWPPALLGSDLPHRDPFSTDLKNANTQRLKSCIRCDQGKGFFFKWSVSHLPKGYSYEKLSLQETYHKLWTYTQSHHQSQVFLFIFF